jgi:hypothetical protein
MWSLCGSVGANTGAVKCDRRRGIPKKIVIGSKTFDSDDYASASTFDDAFLAALKLATGDADKLYPFPEITGVTDATEANKESTLGAFGPKITLIEGRPLMCSMLLPVQRSKKNCANSITSRFLFSS